MTRVLELEAELRKLEREQERLFALQYEITKEKDLRRVAEAYAAGLEDRVSRLEDAIADFRRGLLDLSELEDLAA